MKSTLYLSLFMTFVYMGGASAQSSLKGSLLDGGGAALSYANVILNAAADSSMVKAELSDDEGRFLIPDIPVGSYWLEVSYVGLETYRSEVLELSEGVRDLGGITLSAASEALEEVTVSAIRPILEVKPDKLVFNVEGSVNATGSDGMELLRKAPGVVVDNNDNISLAGKSGVRIFIDGKPSPFSGEDLANYLKSLNSNQIDNIEIITNPSAKFEAEGNAGIINIRLKKNERHGANATVNAGYSIGQYAKYDAGITANFRNKVANVFGSYNYNDGQGFWRLQGYREQQGVTFDQDSRMVNDRMGHNFKFGTDFFINDRNTIGILVNGNTLKGNRMGDSEVIMGTAATGTVDSLLLSPTESWENRGNYTFNLNYRLDLSKESSLNVDLDYGLFRNGDRQYQPNFYTDPTGTQVYSERIFEIDSPSDIDIATFKMDYERPFLKGRLGTGAKVTRILTDNVFDFYNVVEGNPVLDAEQASQFVYSENVNAAYVTYSRKFGKLNTNAGLRMEQSNTRGQLSALNPSNNDDVKRHYVDFFPSGGISYEVNRKNTVQLNYSRRLDRPDYQNLNPFEYKINELTFRKGNPFLRPQYTHNAQFSYTYNYRYIFSFAYSHTTDMMSRVIDFDNTNRGFLTWLNIAKQDNFSFTFSAPVSITKWWDSFTNLTAYRIHNFAAPTDEIKAIDLTVNAMRIYSQHTFSLPWKLKFEVSGWYGSPSVWGGVFRADANYSIDAGLQRKFLKDQLNLRLGVSDIFYSSGWSGRNEYGSVESTSFGGWDSRRFKVNMSYSFGNEKVKSRRRDTGLKDESGRVGGGGN